jgi:hypothetical protein
LSTDGILTDTSSRSSDACWRRRIPAAFALDGGERRLITDAPVSLARHVSPLHFALVPASRAEIVVVRDAALRVM